MRERLGIKIAEGGETFHGRVRAGGEERGGCREWENCRSGVME